MCSFLASDISDPLSIKFHHLLLHFPHHSSTLVPGWCWALRDFRLATLERCREKCITMKLSKSSFCHTRVKWFGRVYSADGVSADPAKIKIIKSEGPAALTTSGASSRQRHTMPNSPSTTELAPAMRRPRPPPVKPHSNHYPWTNRPTLYLMQASMASKQACIRKGRTRRGSQWTMPAEHYQ